MRYEIPVMWHVSPSAKNQGMIPETINFRHFDQGVGYGWAWAIIDVPGNKYSPATDDQAYAIVIKRLVTGKDRRPIAGRSYVRHWRAPDVSTNHGPIPFEHLPKFKKDDRIILHKAYRAEIDFAGYRTGVIDEVLSGSTYGLRLDGYPNIVDFAIRDLAPLE